MIKQGLFACAIFAASFAAKAADATESIPLTPATMLQTEALSEAPLTEELAGRLTIPVQVNGQGPFQFIVDTGADGTVVSTELADRLALPKGKRLRLHAIGGARDVRTVAIDTIDMAGKVLKKINAPALPARNLGADGVIGVDSLQGLRLVIDFESRAMQLQPSSKGDPAPKAQKGEILVTAKSRLGQLVMVDADANGQKVWVVVDTGGQNSIGNSKLRTLLAKRSRPQISQVSLLDVLGEKIPADYAIVQRLRIGGVLMEGAGIAFVDAHPFKEFGLTNKPSMLMGMSGLRNFRRVSIDFSSKTIRFLLPVAE